MIIKKMTDKEVTMTVTRKQARLIRAWAIALDLGNIVQDCQLSKGDIKPTRDLINGLEPASKNIKRKK